MPEPVRDHGDAQRAKQRARAARKPAVTPPPPKLALTLQRTIFWAGVTDDAVQHACRLEGWRHALTSDPAYTPTVEQVTALKASSAGVDAWSNQNQIDPTITHAFQTHWGLSRTIYQAETPAEFDKAMNLGAYYLVGNPNAWTDNQRIEATALIQKGEIAVTGEVYDGRPDTYSSQGVPISSYTLGVALDGDIHYPLGELLADTPAGARSSVCIWHGSGLLPGEWELLGSLG